MTDVWTIRNTDLLLFVGLDIEDLDIVLYIRDIKLDICIIIYLRYLIVRSN